MNNKKGTPKTLHTRTSKKGKTFSAGGNKEQTKKQGLTQDSLFDDFYKDIFNKFKEQDKEHKISQVVGDGFFDESIGLEKRLELAKTAFDNDVLKNVYDQSTELDIKLAILKNPNVSVKLLGYIATNKNESDNIRIKAKKAYQAKMLGGLNMNSKKRDQAEYLKITEKGKELVLAQNYSEAEKVIGQIYGDAYRKTNQSKCDAGECDEYCYVRAQAQQICSICNMLKRGDGGDIKIWQRELVTLFRLLEDNIDILGRN